MDGFAGCKTGGKVFTALLVVLNRADGAMGAGLGGVRASGEVTGGAFEATVDFPARRNEIHGNVLDELFWGIFEL